MLHHRHRRRGPSTHIRDRTPGVVVGCATMMIFCSTNTKTQYFVYDRHRRSAVTEIAHIPAYTTRTNSLLLLLLYVTERCG